MLECLYAIYLKNLFSPEAGEREREGKIKGKMAGKREGKEKEKENEKGKARQGKARQGKNMLLIRLHLNEA